MANKRKSNEITIPPMKYLAYGLEVDQETFFKYMSTFGTPNQMTLEEVKAHEIIRDKPVKKHGKKTEKTVVEEA